MRNIFTMVAFLLSTALVGAEIEFSIALQKFMSADRELSESARAQLLANRRKWRLSILDSAENGEPKTREALKSITYLMRAEEDWEGLFMPRVRNRVFVNVPIGQVIAFINESLGRANFVEIEGNLSPNISASFEGESWAQAIAVLCNTSRMHPNIINSSPQLGIVLHLPQESNIFNCCSHEGLLFCATFEDKKEPNVKELVIDTFSLFPQTAMELQLEGSFSKDATEKNTLKIQFEGLRGRFSSKLSSNNWNAPFELKLSIKWRIPVKFDQIDISVPANNKPMVWQVDPMGRSLSCRIANNGAALCEERVCQSQTFGWIRTLDGKNQVLSVYGPGGISTYSPGFGGNAKIGTDITFKISEEVKAYKYVFPIESQWVTHSMTLRKDDFRSR